MLEIIITILTVYSAPNAVPPTQLAVEIIKQSAIHHLDPVVVTAIVLQESKGVELAYNPTSHDFGLMQINATTARSLNISNICLQSWKCNLKVGTAILANLAKYTDFRMCHYNTGRVGSKRNNYKKCIAYEALLAQYIPKEI